MVSTAFTLNPHCLHSEPPLPDHPLTTTHPLANPFAQLVVHLFSTTIPPTSWTGSLQFRPPSPLDGRCAFVQLSKPCTVSSLLCLRLVHCFGASMWVVSLPRRRAQINVSPLLISARLSRARRAAVSRASCGVCAARSCSSLCCAIDSPHLRSSSRTTHARASACLPRHSTR